MIFFDVEAYKNRLIIFFLIYFFLPYWGMSTSGIKKEKLRT